MKNNYSPTNSPSASASLIAGDEQSTSPQPFDVPSALAEHTPHATVHRIPDPSASCPYELSTDWSVAFLGLVEIVRRVRPPLDSRWFWQLLQLTDDGFGAAVWRWHFCCQSAKWCATEADLKRIYLRLEGILKVHELSKKSICQGIVCRNQDWCLAQNNRANWKAARNTLTTSGRDINRAESRNCRPKRYKTAIINYSWISKGNT